MKDHNGSADFNRESKTRFSFGAEPDDFDKILANLQEAYKDKSVFIEKTQLLYTIVTRSYNDRFGAIDDLWRFLKNLHCFVHVKKQILINGPRIRMIESCRRDGIELPVLTAHDLELFKQDLAIHYGLRTAPKKTRRTEFDPFTEMVQPDRNGLELVAAFALAPDELVQMNFILSRLSVDENGVHVWVKLDAVGTVLARLCEVQMAHARDEVRDGWRRFDFHQRPDAIRLVSIDQRLPLAISKQLYGMLSGFDAPSEAIELELALLDAGVYDEAIECGLLVSHPSNSGYLPVIAPFQRFEYYKEEPIEHVLVESPVQESSPIQSVPPIAKSRSKVLKTQLSELQIEIQDIAGTLKKSNFIIAQLKDELTKLYADLLRAADTITDTHFDGQLHVRLELRSALPMHTDPYAPSSLLRSLQDRNRLVHRITMCEYALLNHESVRNGLSTYRNELKRRLKRLQAGKSKY